MSSRREDLSHEIVLLENDTRDYLIKALRKLAKVDEDFYGGNGVMDEEDTFEKLKDHIGEEEALKIIEELKSFYSDNNYLANSDNENEDDNENETNYFSESDIALYIVKDIEDVEEMLEKFIELWMGNSNYYGKYSIKTVMYEDKIVALSLAFTSGC